MAAKKTITIIALLLTLSLHLTAEDKPKKSSFHAVTHWVAAHKMAIAISVGTAAATGFMLRNSTHSYPAPVGVFDSYRHPCLVPNICGIPPAPPAK